MGTVIKVTFLLFKVHKDLAREAEPEKHRFTSTKRQKYPQISHQPDTGQYVSMEMFQHYFLPAQFVSNKSFVK